jgi:hypothetical protein
VAGGSSFERRTRLFLGCSKDVQSTRGSAMPVRGRRFAIVTHIPWAALAAAATALFATACSASSSSQGGSGSPSAGGSTTSASAVAYSACMRAHGVPNFPDPNSDGQLHKVTAEQLGVGSSQLQAAQSACQALLPDTGGSLATSLRQCEEQGNCPQAVVQQVMTQLRKFSACMRADGVPKWPDPVLDSQGRPEVVIKPWLLGVNPDSNQVNSLMDQCRQVEHPQVPTPIEEFLPPSGHSS